MRTSHLPIWAAGAALTALLAGCGASAGTAAPSGPASSARSASPSGTTSATDTTGTTAGATDEGDRADTATEAANLAVITGLFATDPPGLAAGSQAVVARTAADGDLVAVHWHETTDPAQPWSGKARMDLFRLVDGKVTTHWALSQDVPPSGLSGHTMFDDAHPAAGTAAPDEQQEETQRQFAVAAYDTLFRDQDATVLDRAFDPGYLQHNPVAGDGTAALAQFFSGGSTFPPQESAISLADGDLVWTFSRAVGSTDPDAFGAGDVFRVVDGKIAEHWDVVPSAPVTPTTS